MGRNSTGACIRSTLHFWDVVEEDQIDKQIAEMEVGSKNSNASASKLVDMAPL